MTARTTNEAVQSPTGQPAAASGPQLRADVVYQASQHIFKGDLAKARKPKAIKAAIHRGLLDENMDLQALKALLQSFGEDSVCGEISKLLHEGIFESPKIARRRFLRAEQDQDPPQSGAAASASPEAEGPDVVVAPGDDRSIPPDQGPAPAFVDQARAPTPREATPPDEIACPFLVETASLLYEPVVLDMQAQHLVLTRAQSILELACFRLAERHLPHVLQETCWKRAESGELSKWSHILWREKDLLLQKSDNKFEDKFQLKLRQFIVLRNVTVHRELITVDELEGFLMNAACFLADFGELGLLKSLAVLQEEIRDAVKWIQDRRKTISSIAQPEIQKLDHQIAALDDAKMQVAVQVAEVMERDNRAINENLIDRLHMRLANGIGLYAKVLQARVEGESMVMDEQATDAILLV